MMKSNEDDLGLPESPIFSNYVKHLWKAHTRHGGVQSPNRSRENTDGPESMRVELPLAEGKPLPVAREDKQ